MKAWLTTSGVGSSVSMGVMSVMLASLPMSPWLMTGDNSVGKESGKAGLFQESNSSGPISKPSIGSSNLSAIVIAGSMRKKHTAGWRLVICP